MSELGDRIKLDFESKTRVILPPKKWIVLRLDGRSFSSYTSKLEKPFDIGFVEDFNSAIVELASEAMGCKFAYSQSDEVSLFLSDDAKDKSQSWFGGNLQKICSVSASILSSEFNRYRFIRSESLHIKRADFDARAFSMDTEQDILSYLVWRQTDCYRNAINMVAHQHLSTKQLHGVKTHQKIEMLKAAGIDVGSYHNSYFSGRILKKIQQMVPIPESWKGFSDSDNVLRNVWNWSTPSRFNLLSDLSSLLLKEVQNEAND